MSSNLWMSLAPFSLLLAGCVNEPIGKRDPALGEAVKYNAAVQTISPDPIYPEGSAQPGDIGDKAARAVKRYREGEVKPVETMGTTGGAGEPQ
jgi:outer membrane murein-binding lipoprotein Lpp